MTRFEFPFPVREFPDRGAKWLLQHPDHLRDVLRIALGDVVEQTDFERLQPFPTIAIVPGR